MSELSDLFDHLGTRLEGRLEAVHSALRVFAPAEAMMIETVVLDAAGGAERSWHGQYRAVMISNGSGGAVVIAEGPRQNATPGIGAGVVNLAAGQSGVLPLRGHILAIYGAPGASVTLAVYASEQAPSLGGGNIQPTSNNAALTTVAGGVATAQVVGVNSGRLGLFINNEGPATALVAYAAAATLTAYTVAIPPGYWEMPSPVWPGAISVITATGVATLRVTELT